MPPDSLLKYAKWALGVAGTFILIVAVPLGAQNLYLMAATLFLIPLASYCLGRWLMIGLSCERVLPPSCSEGSRVSVTLTVHNPGRFSTLPLRLQDRLPRFLRPVSREMPLLLGLRPGETASVEYVFEPEKRGLYTLGPTLLTGTDPLGFYSFRRLLPSVSELLVYPTPLPLRRSFLRGASPAWMGEFEAAARGGGIDFQGVREFLPGDELRRVHWRTTARTGRLAVTEYAQETALDILLALDLSQSAYAGTGAGTESALEYAVKIAVTLLHEGQRHGHAVHLLTPSTVDALDRGEARASRASRDLETLARAEANSPLTLAALLGRYAGPVGAATLVYITPDAGNPELAAALREYEARGARAFGFALDANSFRSGRSGEARREASGAGGPVLRVRRGDDLTQILEGGPNGRF